MTVVVPSDSDSEMVKVALTVPELPSVTIAFPTEATGVANAWAGIADVSTSMPASAESPRAAGKAHV